MNAFNELFEEAKKVSDRRTKVFSNLKKEFTDKILPKVSEVMESLQEDKLILDSYLVPFYSEQTAFNEDGDKYSVTVDFKDSTFAYNVMNMQYQLYVPDNAKWKDLSDIKNVDLIVFIEKISESLKALIRCKSSEAEKANLLLNK